jgi:two-component system chemotaxis response regulator CheB
VVAVGASMGGVEALRTMFSSLPSQIAAAFVIVLHRSSGENVMSPILERASGLPARLAKDGESLEPGVIYVAPPGLHTTVEDGQLRVAIGPRENGQRPSVDALFRSVARSWTVRTVGIVLSGALDCGASGLVEIKRRGGVAIVQDPETAINPQMPLSALDLVEADHVVPPGAIGELVAQLSAKAPRRLRSAAGGRASDRPASFVCPECNGPIWETANERQYRCRVGHRYSAEAFFSEKERRLESALWEALNVMQERIELSHRMAARARENGHDTTAASYESRAADTSENAALLRDLIYRSDGMLPIDDAPRLPGKSRKARRGGKRGV